MGSVVGFWLFFGVCRRLLWWFSAVPHCEGVWGGGWRGSWRGGGFGGLNPLKRACLVGSGFWGGCGGCGGACGGRLGGVDPGRRGGWVLSIVPKTLERVGGAFSGVRNGGGAGVARGRFVGGSGCPFLHCEGWRGGRRCGLDRWPDRGADRGSFRACVACAVCMEKSAARPKYFFVVVVDRARIAARRGGGACAFRPYFMGV